MGFEPGVKQIGSYEWWEWRVDKSEKMWQDQEQASQRQKDWDEVDGKNVGLFQLWRTVFSRPISLTLRSPCPYSHDGHFHTYRTFPTFPCISLRYCNHQTIANVIIRSAATFLEFANGNFGKLVAWLSRLLFRRLLLTFAHFVLKAELLPSVQNTT